MRIMLLSVQVFGLSCLLAGCGGGALHEAQSWLPPADTQKATSDWDVASGICDKVALGTELTEEEKAQIELDQTLIQLQARQLDQQITHNLQSGIGDPNLNMALQGANAAIALWSAFSGATEGEDKKEEAFLKCMEKLDWEMKDDGESDTPRNKESG